MTGLEPVRLLTHAPQTCLSTSSSTLAYRETITISNKGIIAEEFPFVNNFFLFSSVITSFPYRHAVSISALLIRPVSAWIPSPVSAGGISNHRGIPARSACLSFSFGHFASDRFCISQNLLTNTDYCDSKDYRKH